MGSTFDLFSIEYSMLNRPVGSCLFHVEPS